MKKWAWPTFFSGGQCDGECDEQGRRIESVVAPVAAARGLFLVDLEFRREGRRWVLRVVVDKPGGVGIADCQGLSQELGDGLDVAGVIDDSYDLEVSSPGLDRELRKERELQWAIGKQVRCWVSEPIDGRREFAGVLAHSTGDMLVLTEAGGATATLPRRLVTKVKLDPMLPDKGRKKRVGGRRR